MCHVFVRAFSTCDLIGWSAETCHSAVPVFVLQAELLGLMWQG